MKWFWLHIFWNAFMAKSKTYILIPKNIGYYQTLSNYEAFWKCDFFQRRVKSPWFVFFTKTPMFFISILKENYLLHINEWGTIQNAIGYILRCKKLELSNFEIVLVIRDQSGSEILGHTVGQTREIIKGLEIKKVREAYLLSWSLLWVSSYCVLSGN